MKIRFPIGCLLIFCSTALVGRAAGGNNGEKDSLKVMALLNSAEACIKTGGKNCVNELNRAQVMAEAAHSPYLLSGCYCARAAAERKSRSQSLFQYNAAALKAARESGNDSLIMHCLLNSSHDLCNAGKTDIAQPLVNECNALAKKTANRLLKLRVGYEYGFYFYRKNDFDAARQQYTQALNIANMLNNEHWIAVLKRSIYLAEVLGYFPEKQSAYIFESIDYFNKKDPVETANCLYVIGRSYLVNGNTKKAIEYYNAAVPLFHKAQYFIEEGEANLGVAEACLQLKDVNTGIMATDRARSLNNSYNYPPGKIRSLISYARLYSAAGKIEKANEYFEAADSLLKLFPDKSLKFLYLGSIMEKYRGMGKLDDIEDTVVLAASLQREVMPPYMMIRLAQRAKSNHLLKEDEFLDIKKFSYSGKSDSALWEKKQEPEGLNPLTASLPRFDSSYNAMYNRQITEMETKFRTRAVKDSLDKTVYENTLKQAKINQQSWLISFITAIALFAGILLYRINQEKKRAIADRKTIELLKEEADHRVKNTFGNIDSIIRDVKAKTNDVGSIQTLEQRIEPLRVLFKILGNTSTGAVNLQQYFETISTSLATSFVNTGDVQVRVDAPVTVEGDKASRLGLIVNELLTNSFKHAFKETGNGIITIECKKEPSGKYHLLVNDNGNGLPENTIALRRGGLTQVRALAQQLNADCEIKNNAGAQFECWFL